VNTDKETLIGCVTAIVIVGIIVGAIIVGVVTNNQYKLHFAQECHADHKAVVYEYIGNNLVMECK
jgi:hypothetical protein